MQKSSTHNMKTQHSQTKYKAKTNHTAVKHRQELTQHIKHMHSRVKTNIQKDTNTTTTNGKLPSNMQIAHESAARQLSKIRASCMVLHGDSEYYVPGAQLSAKRNR